MFYAHLKPHIEALLFAAGDPLPAARIAQILEIDLENTRLLLAELTLEMQQESRGVAIVEIAGGYQMCTKPQFAAVVAKLAEAADDKLSPAALETLSIIAFRQPITKPEIENIRGVKADRAVQRLLERGLIKEAGRKEAVGRPILYRTTDVFLQCFGLNRVEDLPAMPDINDGKQSPK